MIIDSIGFSATHTITEILESLPETYVSHGSRNFDLRKPLGMGDVGVEDFVRQVSRKASEGLKPFALHCVFHPRETMSACSTLKVPYKVLVRRPSDQVRSCYSWAIKEILAGHPGPFSKVVEAYSGVVLPSGVNPTFSNAVYSYACMHVMNFNIAAVSSGAEIVRMEEILGSKEKFCQVFDLDGDMKIAHFDDEEIKRASHKSKLSELNLMEPDITDLQGCLSPAIGGKQYSWKEFEGLLGY